MNEQPDYLRAYGKQNAASIESASAFYTRLHNAIVEKPERSIKSIAREFGIRPDSVRHHKTRLRKILATRLMPLGNIEIQEGVATLCQPTPSKPNT